MMFATFLVIAAAQTIDAAVEVATGLGAITADLEVEVSTGLALGADEKWEVVGACSNQPSIKVEFVTGLSAIGADLEVEIVDGLGAISADRKICITNAEELDAEMLKLLKLRDD